MVHTLALEVLILDRDVQPRATMSRSTIRDYAVLYAEGQMLAPIDVYHEGGHYRVADGFHRVQAARQAGRTEITATVWPGTKREALLHACRANKHGKPLTNEDKRRVVTRMLEDAEWGQWSDNTIAKHCGVAQSFVSKRRRSLHSEISEPRTYTTRHGTVATMDTRAIGKRAASPAEARAADAAVSALLGSRDAGKAVRPEAGAHAIPVTHGETEGIVHPASPPAASQEQLELLRERPPAAPAALSPAPTPAPPPTSGHIVAPAHGGALAAPPRAQPWVLAMRDTLARLLEEARTSLQRLQEYLDTLQETQGYRQLTAEDEQPFASLHAFVTAPPPYGLGCDWSGWAAVVAALHTVLGDQSPAPAAAPLPQRPCPTPAGRGVLSATYPGGPADPARVIYDTARGGADRPHPGGGTEGAVTPGHEPGGASGEAGTL